ncbi:uncharacterized protein LOC111128609 [Crassostrea virginica]
MNTKIVLKACVFCVLFVITIGLSDDEMMQAACAAVGPSSGFISAVRRRTCHGSNDESCETICRYATCSMRNIYGNQGSTSGTCFEAFHLYQKRNTLKNGETGKAAIAILRYGKPSCKSRTVCGPNYCCCRA